LKPEEEGSGSRPNSDRVRVRTFLLKRRAAVRKTYQGTGSKSKQKFEVMGNGKLLVEMPLRTSRMRT